MVTKIKNLCEKAHITITKLERETGLYKSTIRFWDDSPPSIDKVAKVALYFDVSVDYLIGNTTDPHSHKPARVVEALEDIQAYVQQKIDPLKGGQSK